MHASGNDGLNLAPTNFRDLFVSSTGTLFMEVIQLKLQIEKSNCGSRRKNLFDMTVSMRTITTIRMMSGVYLTSVMFTFQDIVCANECFMSRKGVVCVQFDH